MVKLKRGNIARIRRKKILKLAKGFKGAHSRLFRAANGQIMKGLVYSYFGRKNTKRTLKGLWLCRLNAAARNENRTYSRLKKLFKTTSSVLNLKMLAQLSVLDKETFLTIFKNFKDY